MDPQAILDLIAGHKWYVLAALVIGTIVRYFKSDTIGPSIPARWRPWFALSLGGLSGVVIPVLEKIGGGTPPKDAIAWGIFAALLAMGGQNLFIQSLAGGKEIPLPGLMKKPDSGNGPPSAGAGGIAIGAFCMFLAACAAAGPILNTLTDVTSCAVNRLVAGDDDPKSIVMNCDGLAAKDLKGIVDSLIADANQRPPRDAGGALLAAPDPFYRRLQAVRSKLEVAEGGP